MCAQEKRSAVITTIDCAGLLRAERSRTHAILLVIHAPEALHKGLVFLGYCKPGGKDVGVAGTGVRAEVLVEVEEEIVKDGELLVDGGVAVADLLV